MKRQNEVQRYYDGASSKTPSSEFSNEDDVRDDIGTFLRKNVRRIRIRGGSAAVKDLDRENGEVSIQLGGACSGCGASPTTIQAIKTAGV